MQTAQAARREYMEVGKKEYNQEQVDQAIQTQAEWIPFRRDNLPFCQGEALKKIVSECHIPLSKITRMFYHGVIKESHGFYGLDVEYKNARVQLYIADNGCSCCVVAADVWDK